MPRIDYRTAEVWQNYHLTEEIWVERPGDYKGVNDVDMSGPERFAHTAPPLFDLVREAQSLSTGAGLTGIGWSFAPLVGMPRLQVNLEGLTGCSPAEQSQLHQRSTYAPENIVFASGGTNLRVIAEWAKTRGKMLFTTGTHLAPTIAGGAATASHGSRLGFGGLQDQIIGMHMITGPSSSVWIERKSKKVLSEKTVRQFADKCIRSDKIFEDALIHLGGMGIVNGVALELTDYKTFHVLADDHAFWPEWLTQMKEGDFQAIAKELGHDAAPTFYEVTINPADFMGPQALHICYFEKDDAAAPSVVGRPLKRPVDAICEMCGTPEEAAAAAPEASNGGLPPGFNLLAVYADQFFEYSKPPIDPSSPGRGWEEIHGDVITGGVAGALYNASYAVSRDEIDFVIPLICSAVEHLPATFIFTMRFVSNSAGTLAFTRFPETVVIEIDGISKNAPQFGETVGQITRTGALIVRDALDTAGIDYSMHWGKLGEVDASKIERDYGPSTNRRSPLGRWRSTREKLIGKDGAKVFWNRALRNYGLV